MKRRSVSTNWNATSGSRQVGRSRVIAVRYTSTDPGLAMIVANRIAKLYVDDQRDQLRASTRNELAQLDGRIAELKVAVAQSGAAVQAFMQQKGDAAKQPATPATPVKVCRSSNVRPWRRGSSTTRCCAVSRKSGISRRPYRPTPMSCRWRRRRTGRVLQTRSCSFFPRWSYSSSADLCSPSSLKSLTAGCEAKAKPTRRSAFPASALCRSLRTSAQRTGRTSIYWRIRPRPMRRHFVRSRQPCNWRPGRTRRKSFWSPPACPPKERPHWQ